MTEMPRELLSALEKDTETMQRFAGLPDPEKDEVVQGVRRARSAHEIDKVVSRI